VGIEGRTGRVADEVEDEKHCIDILTQVSAMTSALPSVASGEHRRVAAWPAAVTRMVAGFSPPCRTTGPAMARPDAGSDDASLDRLLGRITREFVDEPGQKRHAVHPGDARGDGPRASAVTGFAQDRSHRTVRETILAR
jgi:hypothetical protein